MTNVSAPRSRRALLVAAAGGAAALAASAALPLSVAAGIDGDVILGSANATGATTSIDTTGSGLVNAFEGKAAGPGFGVQGSGTGAAGVVGWSITAPDPLLLSDTSYTGILGWSPANPSPDIAAAGVVGVSDDWGVYGDGTVGVYGFGTYGVVGESGSTSAGVTAFAKSATDLALDVYGKVRFSRSGRVSIGAGKSTKIVYLAGTTSGSRVFAVIHSNRGGRWVRAVVPAAGKFTIYLNTTVSSTTYVAWFVIN